MKNIWSSFIISGIIRLSAVSVLLSALLIVLLFAPTATAAGNVSITRTFQPSSTSDTTIIDSEIAAGSQTDNRGTDTIMSTRYPGDGDLRSLVQFDISSLPTGSSSVSGTLTLRCTAATSQIKSRDIGAYRLTAG